MTTIALWAGRVALAGVLAGGIYGLYCIERAWCEQAALRSALDAWLQREGRAEYRRQMEGR